ncbi:MAG TPA: hypothetical protein VLB82_01595 [Thermodesulfobacteriota bacterium]|nr:hypothetical protein [Thermodesulfobacteriota bacterium]
MREKLKQKVSSREILILILFIVGFFMFYLHTKIELIEVGYEISDNKNYKRSLSEKNQMLKAEFLNLKSPDRIEKLALKRGLIYPSQKDILYSGNNKDLSAYSGKDE